MPAITLHIIHQHLLPEFCHSFFFLSSNFAQVFEYKPQTSDLFVHKYINIDLSDKVI